MKWILGQVPSSELTGLVILMLLAQLIQHQEFGSAACVDVVIAFLGFSISQEFCVLGKMNAHFKLASTDFKGAGNIKLISRDAVKDQWYVQVYKWILNAAALPEHYYNSFYHLPMQKFYLREALCKYMSGWQRTFYVSH